MGDLELERNVQAGGIGSPCEGAEHHLGVFGMDEVERIQAERLRRVPSENLLGGGADVGDGAVVAQHENDVRGVVDQSLQSSFR